MLYDIDYAKRVADTAFNQMFASIEVNAFFSWGCDPNKVGCTYYNDMPTLKLHVQGLLHKGWVYVSLNDGKDTYEVTLMDEDRLRVAAHVGDVYFDELGATIDNYVEKKLEWDEETYMKKLSESGAWVI